MRWWDPLVSLASGAVASVAIGRFLLPRHLREAQALERAAMEDREDRQELVAAAQDVATELRNLQGLIDTVAGRAVSLLAKLAGEEN